MDNITNNRPDHRCFFLACSISSSEAEHRCRFLRGDGCCSMKHARLPLFYTAREICIYRGRSRHAGLLFLSLLSCRERKQTVKYSFSLFFAFPCFSLLFFSHWHRRLYLYWNTSLTRLQMPAQHHSPPFFLHYLARLWHSVTSTNSSLSLSLGISIYISILLSPSIDR